MIAPNQSTIRGRGCSTRVDPGCIVGKPYLTGDYGRVAPSLVATDSSSTRESCILGIVIELLRIDRGGWVALFPGNCSTYGFVDIH